MTTAPQQITVLLRDLLSAFVEHPADLKVMARDIAATPTTPAHLLFIVTCSPEDEPILIGKRGAHVQALMFLVERFGEAVGTPYRLSAVTDGAPGEWEKIAPKVATEHDPAGAAALLDSILTELPIGQYALEEGEDMRNLTPREIAAGLHNALAFSFVITPRDPADAAKLKTPQRLIIREATPALNGRPAKPELSVELTTLDILVTLFLAIARRAGVRYSLSVREP